MPVHVVDESGRERHQIRHDLGRPGQRITQQVLVHLVPGDVPPGKVFLGYVVERQQLNVGHDCLHSLLSQVVAAKGFRRCAI